MVTIEHLTNEQNSMFAHAHKCLALGLKSHPHHPIFYQTVEILTSDIDFRFILLQSQKEPSDSIFLFVSKTNSF